MKKINNLVYTFMALSSFNLLFTVGNDQSDSSLYPVHGRTGTARASGQEIPGCKFMPESFSQTGNRAGEAMQAVETTHANEYFCADNLSRSGFRPVPEDRPYPDNNGELYDNLMYREWCEETFDDGKHIYEAYKDIAFNIKYTPEPAKTDIWQTPFETSRSKKGDCEDAVFVFFSHLSSNQKNAMIIWGWVVDKESRVARAHVWYQLTDKSGEQYIVEGFSKDWNGIIPMDIVEETELRRPIFSITHLEVCRLAGLISRPDSWQAYLSLINSSMSADFVESYSTDRNISRDIGTQHYPDLEVIDYLLNTQGYAFEDMLSHMDPADPGFHSAESREISNILEKLHELFTRCENQKEGFGSYLQIADGSIINTSPDINLNCRR